MDFTELDKKIFSASADEIALFMFNVGITEKPVLSSFENDCGIFERLFLQHITDSDVLALKMISEDVFLRVLGMHSFGAGAYFSAKQADFGHSVSDFSQDEIDSIFSDFDGADAYELALGKLKIPLDSGNRKMLDRIIVIGIKEAKLIAGEKATEEQNLKAFMRVLFSAGISVYVSGKN